VSSARPLEEPRAAEWRHIQRRLAVGLTAANVVGGIIVFVFLGLVVPAPAEVAYDWGLLLRNIALFVPFLVGATIAANVFGPRIGVPVRAWFVAGREPDPRERTITLRQPLYVFRLTAGIWTGALVLFTAFNAFESLPLAAMIALTIGFGGLISSALAYLLDERIEREITAAALASEVPDEPAGPGVETRVVLGWALGGGIPLLGGMLLAVAVLLGADVSADQIAGTILFLGVFGLAFGLVLMRMAARSVAGPVKSVRSAQREVEAGKLDAEVSVYDGSEIGLMQAGFNRMVAGLRERERLHDLFGRHVGEEVARRALERGVELGGEVRQCATLFVDVLGSTELAASRPAPEVVALLNRFFAIVIEVVHGHGGLVNKFEGDAALCIFGAPLEAGDAASRALSAARQLQERLREDLPELRAAIGVSSGEAVAGNVGAAERYEYTVIGDPVNEAARLTELAKEQEPRVLASEAVLSAAHPDEASRWQLGEGLTLRGRSKATRIASPRGYGLGTRD
jgi:adenylate cyclase